MAGRSDSGGERRQAFGHAWMIVAVVLASGCSVRAATDLPVTDDFAAAGCVEIAGYAGDAMEPFIVPTTGDLLFNNNNSPPEQTDLHWARRIDDGRFEYVGPVEGANSAALDGVPSVDESGNIHFVSTRSYDRTLSTLYRGRWAGGTVTQVGIVQEISRKTRGLLDFDAEISRDGDWLFYVEGQFSGSPIPDSAHIAFARRTGERFVRDASSDRVLSTVNTPALEYAPALSADRRELFFTRFDPGARTIAIYRARRTDTDQVFGPVERVAAADGFVEAPALSPDGAVLYFHRLEAGQYRICKANRKAAGERQSEAPETVR